MKYYILNESITGYKNKEKSKKSQDSMAFIINEDYIILSVADGHSTEFFKYSKEGANFACQTVLNVLNINCKNSRCLLKENLKNEKIQREIYDNWMNLVAQHYRTYDNLAYKTEYLKYSTTLIGLLLTNEFTLCLRVGDGNIVIKDANGYRAVFEHKNECRVIDSLGRFNSYKFINYKFENIRADELSLVSIFTDGYENSFRNYEKLEESLEEMMKTYNKNVFTRNKLIQNYKEYLVRLSEKKSKDDITIINMIK